MNIWEAWTVPEYSICKKYVRDGMGASLATAPSGILNAILTNLGAKII